MQLGPRKPADGPPKPNRERSFIYFRRVLRYVWPHRRILIPAVVCIVIVAASFSVGIAGLLPVIQGLVKDEGVAAWIHESGAEKRLGADMHTFHSDESEQHLRWFEGSALVTRLEDNSPLRSAGVRASHLPAFIVGIARQSQISSVVFRNIANAPADALIDLWVVPKAAAPADTAPATQPAPRHVRLSNIDRTARFAMWAADWLPSGRSPRDKLTALAIILAALLVVQVIGGVARFGGEYLTAVVAGRALVSVRREMYRKVLRLPVSFFAQRGTSDVMSRFVQDSQRIYRGLTYIFSQSLREPLKAIGAFAFALYLNWKITLGILVVAPLALLVIRNFGKSVRKRSRRLLEGYSRMLGALEGALTGVRVVKGYGGESYERRHLYETDLHMYRQQAGIERIDAMTSPILELMAMFFGVGVTLYFANRVFHHEMDVAEFGVISLCLTAMFDAARKLSKFYNRIEEANAGAQRVFEVIDMPDEKTNVGGVQLRTLSHQIELRSVTFCYPAAERPAVDAVNLVVNRGERVAIVGPNGSGKTTLVSLLMRFFDPTGGEILLDGVDVRSASLHSLRRQIGLVTQDSVIFADTIRNNIAYGEPSLLWRLILRRRHPQRRYAETDGDLRVMAAAKAAFAHEFIMQLPQGYDTVVGEHGATLSGGQKQRLAIARAILRNAPILIFDEATSQIDSDSEHRIHEALQHFLQDRTAFIIAHRFSTILEADRIVVMDAGRIVDVGKHAELLGRCGLYRTLFETQLRPAEDAA